MLGKTHEGQPGQCPYVSLALSSNSLHQSVLTGLCMSAPHRDTLKHLVAISLVSWFLRISIVLVFYCQCIATHLANLPLLSGLRTGTGTLLVPCGGGWLQFNVMPRTLMPRTTYVD